MKITMTKAVLIIIVLSASNAVYPQIVLEADGPGDTYELINSVLAPGYNAVEHPECIHPEFGRHIAEVMDADLNKNVFEFYSHVTPDNDRCINLDRQRIEIKTYDSSPDYLKGVAGETITYQWKFKLPVGYQPSSSFTHIHQIKAVGGNDGDPIFTLTPRKGAPNKMELIHDNTTKVAVVNLSLFEGVWVECTEIITVGAAGNYSMSIKRVDNGTLILAYNNSAIMTIRADNVFIRPKWGIYRSLDHPSDLRDEAVRFASFSIKEGVTGTGRSGPTTPENTCLDQNYPNPFNPSTVISYRLSGTARVRVSVFDYLGRESEVLVDETQPNGRYEVKWNAARFPSGIYLCRLQTNEYAEIKKLVLLK